MVDADNLGQSSSINYGQQPWVHTPPASYEGLYQEWSEYVRSVLGYTQDQLAEATKKLAEQEPYVQLMRAPIRPWEPGATYSYGDIVQLNGMTYQAEANDVRLIAPDKADNTAVGVVWPVGTHRTGQDVAGTRRAPCGDAVP